MMIRKCCDGGAFAHGASNLVLYAEGSFVWTMMAKVAI